MSREAARPSTRLKFTVYSSRRGWFQLRDTILADVEVGLYEVIASRKPLHISSTENCVFNLTSRAGDKYPMLALVIRVSINVPSAELGTGPQPSNDTSAPPLMREAPPILNEPLQNARKALAELPMIAKDKADEEVGTSPLIYSDTQSSAISLDSKDLSGIQQFIRVGLQGIFVSILSQTLPYSHHLDLRTE